MGDARSGDDRGTGKQEVLVVPPEGEAFVHEHDRAARMAIAARLAALHGLEFGGELGAGAVPRRAYLVPADTLTVAAADRLGIGSEADLFGGVVPFSFVGTKVITHPLIDEEAAAPAGWAGAVGTVAPDAVLAGFSAFDEGDARKAGRRLLARGSVRIKPVTGVGGHGQHVAESADALDRILVAADWDALGRTGLALEEDLHQTTTYSVGQVRVAGLIVTYLGVQRHSHAGSEDPGYAGSSLLCARGGHDMLAGLDLSEGARTAILQAEAYDGAAMALYPSFFASRRNYDVGQGRQADGRFRSGVLEQSWRIGGASGAEILALEAFAGNPRLEMVKVASFEIPAVDPPVPPDALVLFQGVDPAVGPLTKYAAVVT